MTDKKILWLIVGISLMAIALGIGWLRFEQKQEELERNRQYEVSLVKVLKNSYAGIEEIRISDPHYSHKPGNWSCDIEITFKDGKKISYGISHDLDDKVNYGGLQKTEGDWQYLENHKGRTSNGIKVDYSDGEEDEK